MDKDRQVRFLYPPLILLGSLFLAAVRANSTFINDRLEKIFVNQNSSSIVIELLAVSSLILLLGFLLGTVTVISLRFIFWLFFKSSYELKLPDSTYDKIGRLILNKGEGKIAKSERLYAGMVFDHSYISKGIHSWIIRRWNSFFIASSSVVALLISLPLGGCILNIPFTPSWVFTVILFIGLFLFQAIKSWGETMKCLTFLTRVKKEKDSDNEEDPAEDDK